MLRDTRDLRKRLIFSLQSTSPPNKRTYGSISAFMSRRAISIIDKCYNTNLVFSGAGEHVQSMFNCSPSFESSRTSSSPPVVSRLAGPRIRMRHHLHATGGGFRIRLEIRKGNGAVPPKTLQSGLEQLDLGRTVQRLAIATVIAHRTDIEFFAREWPRGRTAEKDLS
jgi:hypothetical protein